MRLSLVGSVACAALVGAGLASSPHAARGADADAMTVAKKLASADEKERAAAVDALTELGENAKPAVPALVGALRDKAPEVRWRAARALAAIGNDNITVSHGLTAGLKDENAQVRAYSAYAFGALKDDRSEVADTMFVLLTDSDAMVRRAAMKALRQMKLPREVSIPLFVKTLSHADQTAVMGAMQTISEAGDAAVPFLIDALKRPESAYWACLTLAEIGPPARGAVGPVAQLLTAKEPEIRLQACMALGAIGSDAKEALPGLLKLLQNDSLAGVRYSAAFAIGGIGVADEGAISALNAAIESNDKFLATVAAAALLRIQPGNKKESAKAVKLLLDGLQTGDERIRQASARALFELKTSSDVLGPALIAALKNSDPAVAKDSLQALGALGPAFLPQIAELLANPELRGYALMVLARFGADAKGATPQLAAMLDDPKLEPMMRREVQYVLGKIGPAAAPAVPQLIASLGNDSERVRNSAIFALGKIGPGAKSAVPALEKLVDSEDAFLRVGSLWALVHIQPGDAGVIAKAVPELIKSLDAERDTVRAEVAGTLGSLGAAAKPALLRSSKKPSPTKAPWSATRPRKRSSKSKGRNRRGEFKATRTSTFFARYSLRGGENKRVRLPPPCGEGWGGMYRDLEQRDFARQLRNDSTPAEQRLWHFLRAGKLGVKFRRQAAIGAYGVDFVCFSHRLVVELDGPQHVEEKC